MTNVKQKKSIFKIAVDVLKKHLTVKEFKQFGDEFDGDRDENFMDEVNRQTFIAENDRKLAPKGRKGEGKWG